MNGFFTLSLAISREDGEDSNHHHQHQLHHHHHHHHNHHRSGHGNNHSNKVPYNGYNSEEYLDRLEPNGNIPANKSDLGYGKRKYKNTLFMHSDFLTHFVSQSLFLFFSVLPKKYFFFILQMIKFYI